MNVDRLSVAIDDGLSAHAYRNHGDVGLFLGAAGDPIHLARICIHAPLSMADKIERIAEMINSIMAEDSHRSAA